MYENPTYNSEVFIIRNAGQNKGFSSSMEEKPRRESKPSMAPEERLLNCYR